jgi:hypothetical protein
MPLVLVVLLLGPVSLLLARSPHAAAASAPEAVAAPEAASPELELAQRYAPYVAVQSHSTACGRGEPYVPTSVDVVLGRPDVVLRD